MSGERGRLSSFAVLMVGVSSFSLVQSLVVPVLGTIRQELGTSQATVTWVLTAYLLSAAVCTPLLGRLGDVVGRRWVMATSLGALAAGSAIAAAAPNIGWMIVARVVQGLGGAATPLAFGIARDILPSRRIAGAVSILSAMNAAGFGVGILLAGPIVEGLGYRWLFLLPMVVTGSAAIVAAIVIPASRPSEARMPSIMPVVLLTCWVTILLLGLSSAGEVGWLAPESLALGAASLVLMGGWGMAESRAGVPLIELRLMRVPAVAAANVASALIGFSTFATYAFLPQFLQAPPEAGYGFHASVTEAGRFLIPASAASFIAGIVTARLVPRFGARTLAVAGGLSMVAAYVVIVCWHHHPAPVYLMTSMLGFGTGMAFSSLSGVAVRVVPHHQSGLSAGVNTNVRTIGGAIGTAVLSAVIASDPRSYGPAEHSYIAGFVILGLSALTAATAATFIPGRHPHVEA